MKHLYERLYELVLVIQKCIYKLNGRTGVNLGIQKKKEKKKKKKKKD